MTKKTIEEMSSQEIYLFQANQSMMFCECSINLMMSTMPIEEVIDYLQSQIEILKEFG